MDTALIIVWLVALLYRLSAHLHLDADLKRPAPPRVEW